MPDVRNKLVMEEGGFANAQKGRENNKRNRTEKGS